MALPENTAYGDASAGIDRITEILKQKSQPVSVSPFGSQAVNLPVNIMNMIRYSMPIQGGDFGAAVQNYQTNQQNQEMSQQKMLLNAYDAKLKMGDAQTKALDDKIKMFVGDDAQARDIVLQGLHNDPESIDPSNAYQTSSKIAGIVKRNGLQNIDRKIELEKARADIAYKQSEANKNNAAATDVGKGPSAVQEYKFYQDLPPDKQQEYLHVKRTNAEDALGITLSKEAAKEYSDLYQSELKINTMKNNINIAKDALSKASLTGPVFGRIGAAAGDPDYVNWIGAQNTLTLQAKDLLGMPSNNFSDADRNFLVDIAGGKFTQHGGAEKSLDRLNQLVDFAIEQTSTAKQDILTRKTFNKEAPQPIVKAPVKSEGIHPLDKYMK